MDGLTLARSVAEIQCLAGGKVEKIQQPEKDELLVDGNGRIVDAVRRVSPSMSSVRLILPKLEYSAPPAQDKLDPAKAAAEDFLSVLSDAPRPDKALSAAFFGLSPSIAALLFDRCTAEAKSRPVHSDASQSVTE